MRDGPAVSDRQGMNSTPTTTSRPTAAEVFEEIAPLVASSRVAGPSVLFLVGPWLLLVLLLIPPAAFLFTLLLVIVVPLGAAGLVVAVLASPYFLVRALRRRSAQRRQSSERPVRVASRVAQTGRSTRQSGIAALAHERQ
jgi:hypothetical protein